MDKTSEILDAIAEEAFNDELKKIAACSGSSHKKYTKKKGPAMAKYAEQKED